MHTAMFLSVILTTNELDLAYGPLFVPFFSKLRLRIKESGEVKEYSM